MTADIYELGLIYRIDMDGDRNVAIVMTLTAPGCPVAGEMPQRVENAVESVTGVGQVKVTLSFDPAVGPGSHIGQSKSSRSICSNGAPWALRQ